MGIVYDYNWLQYVKVSTQWQAGNEYLMNSEKSEFHDQVELRNFSFADQKETRLQARLT
jgi:hypothetical protein